MCGIAGIVPSRDLDPAQLDRWVRRMCQSMVHRGPDDDGVFVAPDIGIGARRLSIIDIKNGRQPMYSSDGRYTIVFNGEIYNYVALREELQRQGCHFTTNCDTEVVLRVFEVAGVDGFQKLEGMFGVAVWDQSEKRLTIARDWLGQKSVYWTRCQFGWAFASEIKALLVLPGVQRRMDLTALSHYMSLRYLPDESTFFDGIHKLPAAHALEVTRSGARPTRLWTPKYEPKSGRDEAALDRLPRVRLRERNVETDVGELLFPCAHNDFIVVRCAGLAQGGPDLVDEDVIGNDMEVHLSRLSDVQRGQSFRYYGGNSDEHAIVGKVFGDDCSRAHGHVSSERDLRKNHRVGTNERIVADVAITGDIGAR